MADLRFPGTPYATDFGLVTIPEPVLRVRPAPPVPDPTDPVLREFCALLEDARIRYHGIGIAAPQVGVSLQVAVINIPAGTRMAYGAGEDTGFVILINPVIIDRSEEMRRAPEGCLSAPGYEGILRRPDRVVVETLTLEGTRLRIEADRLFARCLQHEIDHLHGYLYLDRAEHPSEVRQVTPLEPGDPLLAHNPLLSPPADPGTAAPG